MLEIEIDGKTAQVPDGSTVMDAAQQVGVYIPHFCYHKKLSIAANCRMCLVQVEKAPKPLPACATPVTNGMKVFTHSDLAIKAQKGVMEFLLINHPLDCPICDQGGECQLQDMSVGYGPMKSRYTEEKHVVFHKNVGPLISMEEMSRCIHCTRCVRFGQEVAGIMELYHAKVDSSSIGLNVKTFVLVSLAWQKPNALDNFIRKVKEVPEITECYIITGDADFLLKIVCKDITYIREVTFQNTFAN